MKKLCALILAMAMALCAVAQASDSYNADTPEAYLRALEAARAAFGDGVRCGFNIWLAEGLSDQLFANDEALLRDLERQAGMQKVHYYDFNDKRIGYRNSVFGEADDRVESWMELVELLRKMERAGMEEASVELSPEFFEWLTQQENWLMALDFANENLAPNVTFYAGAFSTVIDVRLSWTMNAILRAAASGNADSLNDDARRALDVARAWAAEIVPGDDLDVARQIYDMICERVVYNEAGKFRSALGALLNGEGVCVSYAETFMLIGWLCGLDVRMQTGEAGGGGHAWNWLRVNGQWRMIDPTWGDLDPGVSYDYFNLSMEEAARTHISTWNPDGTLR